MASATPSPSQTYKERDPLLPQRRQPPQSPLSGSGSGSAIGIGVGGSSNPTSLGGSGPIPQAPLLGPTFGWVGKVIGLLQLPLAAFAVLMILRSEVPLDWSMWIVCSPLFLACLALILVTSVYRFDSPLVARLSWAWALVCTTAFILIIVARIAHVSQFPALSKSFVPFIPHWALAVGFSIIGAGAILRGSCCPRNSASLTAYQKHERFVHRAAGSFLAFLGVLWAIESTLVFLRGSDILPYLSWFVVFSPWWAADGFVLLVCVVMLLFSFGASQSALFTIPQQILFVLLCLCSAAIKIVLAYYLTGAPAVPLVAVLASVLLMEFLFATLGIVLAFGRNYGTILCGRYAGRSMNSIRRVSGLVNRTQQPRMSGNFGHQRTPSSSATVQV